MTTLAPTAEAIVTDTHFPALREHIVSSTGIAFYADRAKILAGYVGERIKKCGLNGCEAYWSLLHDSKVGEAEMDSLFELLSIGETYFFRHPELFEALREVALPEMIERNRSIQRLRIWSAGCSTGAEAYSVSILLRREFAAQVEGWNISIIGTDMNRPFLSQAAEGRYEDWAFRGTSLEFRQECFEKDGSGWRIARRFQEGVTFQYHNLVRHPFPSLLHNLTAFDLVLCRNVLIYFAPETAERVVSQLGECLVPGGWLAIGHAEHGAKCLDALELVSRPGAMLYRKAMDDSVRLVGPDELDCNSSATSYCDRNTLQSSVSGAFDKRAASRVVLDLDIREAERDEEPSGPLESLEIANVRELADHGDVEAALRLCDASIAANPLQANLHFYRALLLDQTDGHAAAMQALVRAIYLDQEFVLAHYYLGTTQLRLSDTAGAAKSFRNVRRLIASRDPAEQLPDAEGMTIGDLEELTRLHIESLEAA